MMGGNHNEAYLTGGKKRGARREKAELCTLNIGVQQLDLVQAKVRHYGRHVMLWYDHRFTRFCLNRAFGDKLLSYEARRERGFQARSIACSLDQRRCATHPAPGNRHG